MRPLPAILTAGCLASGLLAVVAAALMLIVGDNTAVKALARKAGSRKSFARSATSTASAQGTGM